MNANIIPVLIQQENRYWKEPSTWPLGRRHAVYEHIRAAAINYTNAARDIANCVSAGTLLNTQFQRVQQKAIELLTYFLNGMKILTESITGDDFLLPKFLNMRNWIYALELAIANLNVNSQALPSGEIKSIPNCHIVELVLQANFITTNPTPANLSMWPYEISRINLLTWLQTNWST